MCPNDEYFGSINVRYHDHEVDGSIDGRGIVGFIYGCYDRQGNKKRLEGLEANNIGDILPEALKYSHSAFYGAISPEGYFSGF